MTCCWSCGKWLKTSEKYCSDECATYAVKRMLREQALKRLEKKAEQWADAILKLKELNLL